MSVSKSKIEWTDSTWSPVTGCDKVSPGCDHCYAESIAHRFAGTKAYPNGFGVTLRPERLDQPLRWKKPRRIFVNSMSDLFHSSIGDDYIAHIWAIMARCQHHTFQILTKRHARMRRLLQDEQFYRRVYDYLVSVDYPWINENRVTWPLPNVHLGVSAEDQKWADIRIPALLQTPAAVRFVSAEPLLGPIDFTHMDVERHTTDMYWINALTGRNTDMGRPCADVASLDWVIVGGESGSGARPMHVDWARSLRDQCERTGVAFYFKQWGEWVPESMWLHSASAPAAFLAADGTVRKLVNGKPVAAPMSRGQDMTIRRAGKKQAGRELDGRTWDQYPVGS